MGGSSSAVVRKCLDRGCTVPAYPHAKRALGYPCGNLSAYCCPRPLRARRLANRSWRSTEIPPSPRRRISQVSRGPPRDGAGTGGKASEAGCSRALRSPGSLQGAAFADGGRGGGRCPGPESQAESQEKARQAMLHGWSMSSDLCSTTSSRGQDAERAMVQRG